MDEKNKIEKAQKKTVLDVLVGVMGLAGVIFYLSTRFTYGGSINHYTKVLFEKFPILAPSYLFVFSALALIRDISGLRRGEAVTFRLCMHFVFYFCAAVSFVWWLKTIVQISS